MCVYTYTYVHTYIYIYIYMYASPILDCCKPDYRLLLGGGSTQCEGFRFQGFEVWWLGFRAQFRVQGESLGVQDFGFRGVGV